MAAVTTKEELAVFGGPKTVTLSGPKWPRINDAELAELEQCVINSRDDWTDACSAVGGGIGQRLEERFCEIYGRQFAIATCGGGAALHIACLAAGVGLGDEVIATPYSWGQTVSCILQAGGIPVFADIDPERLTLDPASVEARITPRTKAIVLVHIYGIPADMDGILQVARRHNLVVIEDCAQAQGSREGGRFVGTRGDFGCFSIGSGKNVAAGDGGVLVTDDRRYFERALLAGMHPGRMHKQIEDEELKERIDSLIFTYRINTFTAAIAYRQMDRLDEMNDWRRRNYAWLAEALADVPGIRPQQLPTGVEPAWHMGAWTFVAEDVPGVSRDQYLKALRDEGVPIGGSYVGKPIHLRRTFQRKEWWLGNGYPWAATPEGEAMTYRQGDCPVAEKRCFELDVMMGGGSWYTDLRPLLEQIAAAFRKVTAQAERLSTIEL